MYQHSGILEGVAVSAPYGSSFPMLNDDFPWGGLIAL